MATSILFGKLTGVATLFVFGEKRCRKNLPLAARSLLKFVPITDFHGISRGVVFNDVDPSFLDEHHDLGVGWTLRPASPDELSDTQVTRSLETWSSRRGGFGVPANRLLRGEVLPWTDARVLVVEAADDVAIGPWSLNQAFAISDSEMRIGHFFGDAGSSMPWMSLTGFRVRNDLGAVFDDCPRPAKEHLDDLRETLAVRAAEPPENVTRAINLFLSLDRLPDNSVMKQLGYFTVVESLLSHAPSDNDRADSIRRQLERNLVLIDHRLMHTGREIGFGDFGGANPDTVLGKLYSYRSAIAHGSSLKKPIEQIKKLMTETPTSTSLWLHDWLRRMVRRVLFAALREPELITDLK